MGMCQNKDDVSIKGEPYLADLEDLFNQLSPDKSHHTLNPRFDMHALNMLDDHEPDILKAFADSK